MLDQKLIVNKTKEVIENLTKRNGDFSFIEKIKVEILEKNTLLEKLENLNNKRNVLSKSIGQMMQKRAWKSARS